MAAAAAAAMDNLMSSNIVGTLAGDDTVFVLCRDENGALEFKNLILEFITA